MISSGCNPNDPLQICQPEQTKKIIIHCQKGMCITDVFLCKTKFYFWFQNFLVTNGLAGHSLSWTYEKSATCRGSVMIAKIWTPEDPRNLEEKNQEIQSLNYDMMTNFCSSISDIKWDI